MNALLSPSSHAIDLLRFNVEAFGDDASTHSAIARAFELAGSADSSKAHTARALAIDSLDTRALERARRLGNLSCRRRRQLVRFRSP